MKETTHTLEWREVEGGRGMGRLVIVHSDGTETPVSVIMYSAKMIAELGVLINKIARCQ